MSKTDHYSEAVADIDWANDCSSEDPLGQQFLARAQVHATLALVDAVRAQTEALTAKDPQTQTIGQG